MTEPLETSAPTPADIQDLVAQRDAARLRCYQLGTGVWKKVVATEVFQDLKHGRFRDILDLLADGEISVGKASQSIVERAGGIEPSLPALQTAFADDLSWRERYEAMAKEKDARIKELEDEMEDSDKLRDRLSEILTETANALHGGPLKNGSWSFHDLAERAHQLQEQKAVSPLKMYIWRGSRDYLVVAHAISLANARTLALEEANGEGDASTPVICRAIEAIRNHSPEIFYRENAEFVLTTSGEVEEQILYSETLSNKIKSLEAQLAAKGIA